MCCLNVQSASAPLLPGALEGQEVFDVQGVTRYRTFVVAQRLTAALGLGLKK